MTLLCFEGRERNSKKIRRRTEENKTWERELRSEDPSQAPSSVPCSLFFQQLYVLFL